MEAKVGKMPSGFGSKVYGSDLWTVSDKIVQVQEGIDTDLENLRDAQPAAEEAKELAMAAQQSVQVLTTSLRQTMEAVNRQSSIIGDLRQQLQSSGCHAMFSPLGSVGGRSSGNGGSSGPTQAEFDALKETCRDMELQIANLTSVMDSADPSVRLDTVQDSLEPLKKQIVNQASVSHDGNVYNSAEDILDRHFDELDKMSVAYCMDAFTLFANSDVNWDGARSWTDTMAAANKAGYTSQEINILWCLSMEVPHCLIAKTPGKSEVVPQEEGFGGTWKSYDKFIGKDRAVSARDVTKQKVRDLVTSLIKAMKLVMPQGPLLREMLVGGCQEAKNHVMSILDFIGEYYLELVDQCHHPPVAAWVFVGWLIWDFMHAVAVPRKAVANLTAISTPEVKAEIMWAFLQSNAIMERLVNCGFKSDPVCTAAMSNFIMKYRVDRSAFSNLEEKVAKATKKTDGLEGGIKPLKATVQDHGKLIANLQKTKKDK